MAMDGEDFMRQAIAASRRGMAGGAGGPFGAVVVLDGKVVAEGVNQVTSTNDPTAHAEVVAIREAATRLGTCSRHAIMPTPAHRGWPMRLAHRCRP